MTFDFDTSELSQAAARKVTPHDNCVVLDLGTGSFPRDIEVRLPDDDGARQIAIWDGSLNLSINDEVFCNEYAGNPKWRIASMGGANSGAGKQRISEVWESDFGAVALEADVSGNITINGARTLTIPTDLIHAGDADTKLSFADDALEATVGNLSMLKLTETTQNLVEIGDTAGGGNVDVNFNNGQAFLRGSDEFFGLGIIAPIGRFHVLGSGFFDSSMFFERSGSGQNDDPGINLVRQNAAGDNDRLGGIYWTRITSGGSYLPGASIRAEIDGTPTDTSLPTALRFLTADDGTVLNNGSAPRMVIHKTGRVAVGMGDIAPSAQVHIDQASTTEAIPVIALDQADLSEEFVNFISTIGAGNPIDTAAIGTFYGKIRVAVNGTFKYIALYNS